MKPLQDFELKAYKCMRVIDCHMHLGHDVSPEYLLYVMDRYNIEKAIVMPLDFNGFDLEQEYNVSLNRRKSKEYISKVLKNLVSINENFLDKVRPYSDRLIPFIWVSSECEGIERLISKPEVKGVKGIPPLDNRKGSDEAYIDDISCLFGVAFDEGKMGGMHNGWLARPGLLSMLAERFKNHKMLMMHAKEDDDSYKFERYQVLRGCPNVLLEISYYQLAKRVGDFVKFLTTIDESLRKVDAGIKWSDRLLFGSDFITKGYECNIAHQILGVKLADITKEQEEDILYNNAARLFNRFKI